MPIEAKIREAVENAFQDLPVDYPHCVWERYGLKPYDGTGDPDEAVNLWREECRDTLTAAVLKVVEDSRPTVTREEIRRCLPSPFYGASQIVNLLRERGVTVVDKEVSR